LVVASSAAGYGVELAIATSFTSEHAPPVTRSMSERRVHQPTSDGLHQTFMTIIVRDPATGSEDTFPCVTTIDRVLPQEVVVDRYGLAEVASALCGSG
jgi:hypothetical protein